MYWLAVCILFFWPASTLYGYTYVKQSFRFNGLHVKFESYFKISHSAVVKHYSKLNNFFQLQAEAKRNELRALILEHQKLVNDIQRMELFKHNSSLKVWMCKKSPCTNSSRQVYKLFQLKLPKLFFKKCRNFF